MISHSSLNFTSTSNPISSQIPTFKVGVTGVAVGNWDGTIASAGFAGADYSPSTLEPFMIAPMDWSGDYNDMIPVLATDWTIINWPEGPNSLGWNNTGGVQAIELTLRPGVTFHDGSAWNATVAKWNIDRAMVISGNITGSLTLDMMTDEMYRTIFNLWLSVWDWAPYETASWNITQFIGQTASYAEYGTTGSIHSSFSWLYADRYCRVKNVTILEDLASGGKIRVNFNDWSSIFLYVDDLTMISMDAYKDYFDTPIYGLGDVSGFSQPDVSGGYPSTGFPGHLIGTGPYRFIEHDDVLQQGTMQRFDNWWNSTAMQANGWHQVPEIAIVTFPYSDAGFAARNLAMVTGTIDYAEDDGTLVYTDMIADPDINYIEGGIGADRNFITLNGINETYWKDWADLGPSVVNLTDPTYSSYPYLGNYTFLADIDDTDGRIHTDGINRAMRKAVSYAFEYDTYINIIQGGRAVRSGGLLGTGNEYYNPSIPLAYYNLTIARQALIDDPYWGPMVAARGLGITNSTAEWVAIANTNPIFEFKMMWDQATYDVASVFGNSIKDIGLTLGGFNGAPDPALLIQPDLPTAMFDFEGGGIEQIPFFTSHGHPTNWPGTNFGSISALEYYYKSPGVTYDFDFSIFPYEAILNSGFHYNQTVDDWIEMAWFSDRARSQEIYNNLTRHFQTYQYSDIMISHRMWGYAIDKDWELGSTMGFEFLKYTGSPPSPPPGDIALSSDAGTPDINGNFNLIWNVSIGADNYSIYRYNDPITQINGSLVLIADQVATSPFPISGLIDGEYYFVVVAHNQSGDTISNNVHVTVSKPVGPTTPGISGYNTFVILGIIIFTAVILCKRKKRKYKWKYLK